jgi:hypothetical protein
LALSNDTFIAEQLRVLLLRHRAADKIVELLSGIKTKLLSDLPRQFIANVSHLALGVGQAGPYAGLSALVLVEIPFVVLVALRKPLAE